MVVWGGVSAKCWEKGKWSMWGKKEKEGKRRKEKGGRMIYFNNV